MHWYINLTEVQSALQKHALATGEGVHYVFAGDDGNLLMPIPAIQHQQDIVAHYKQERESCAKVEEVNKARLLRVETCLLLELTQD